MGGSTFLYVYKLQREQVWKPQRAFLPYSVSLCFSCGFVCLRKQHGWPAVNSKSPVYLVEFQPHLISGVPNDIITASYRKRSASLWSLCDVIFRFHRMQLTLQFMWGKITSVHNINRIHKYALGTVDCNDAQFTTFCQIQWSLRWMIHSKL